MSLPPPWTLASLLRASSYSLPVSRCHFLQDAVLVRVRMGNRTNKTSVTYGPNLQFPDWWGNTVWQNTADGLGTPWMQMPTIGYFGGANGTWA